MTNEMTDTLAVIEASYYLDFEKMSFTDQLLYCVAYSNLADQLRPLVKKYIGSVEELQKKKELSQKKNIEILKTIIAKVGSSKDDSST